MIHAQITGQVIVILDRILKILGSLAVPEKQDFIMALIKKIDLHYMPSYQLLF